MAKQRCLMLGAGGMARAWIRDFYAPFRDRMEFAALVDVNPDVLAGAGDELGLPASALFTDPAQAFANVEADYCCIVTPPAYHREAIELACARGMNILSEKPISVSWEDCCAIYKTVKSSGVQMMVTQNYRYSPRILTLKAAIAQLGKVNFVTGRYACDYRVRNSWGAFRHTMEHSLLIEGGIHHLDQLRNLSGGDYSTIAGHEWNPGATHGSGGEAGFKGSSSFDNQCCALFTARMENGAFANYEGNNLATGKLNCWHSEYYRAECEGGAAVLDSDHTVRIEERGTHGGLVVRTVPDEAPEHAGHQGIVQQFLDWQEGGPAPVTTLDDNMRSTAALFAAIEASATGSTVDVAAMVKSVIDD